MLFVETQERTSHEEQEGKDLKIIISTIIYKGLTYTVITEFHFLSHVY